MRLDRLALTCITATAAAATPAAAQQAELASVAAAEEAPSAAEQASTTAAEFVTGLDYQQGNYFTGESIKTLSVNNAVRVRTGRVTVSASLPYHRIEAPGNVVGGGGVLGLPIIVDPTQPSARTRREGIGDLRVGASYALPRLAGFDLSLTGQVKLPTASRARAIGTGETDVSVGGELSRTLGAVTPFVSVAYTLPGDPEGYRLRNSLSARGGVAMQLGQSLRGNVAYGYARSISPLVPDEQQISTGLNASVGRTLSLGVYGNAGLSQGSPDVGAGVALGFRLF